MRPFTHAASSAFVVLVLASNGCKPSDTSSKFTDPNYGPLATAVRNADKVILHEGLPHQLYEKQLLDQELKAKKTVEYHGFPFYKAPIVLKEQDAQRLTDLFCDSDSFSKHIGPKGCGGFHPDYCLEWRVGTATYQALICFGCGEMQAFGPENNLHCDVVTEARKKFKDVLRSYRTSRPETTDEYLRVLMDSE